VAPGQSAVDLGTNGGALGDALSKFSRFESKAEVDSASAHSCKTTSTVSGQEMSKAARNVQDIIKGNVTYFSSTLQGPLRLLSLSVAHMLHGVVELPESEEYSEDMPPKIQLHQFLLLAEKMDFVRKVLEFLASDVFVKIGINARVIYIYISAHGNVYTDDVTVPWVINMAGCMLLLNQAEEGFYRKSNRTDDNNRSFSSDLGSDPPLIERGVCIISLLHSLSLIN
jgi:hypothetical protein